MLFIRSRPYGLYLILLSCLLSFPFGVSAQEASQSDSPMPRIESDPVRNAFIFIIDGEEIARLDKSGFYVHDSITFGGSLADAGRGWVDEYISGHAVNASSEKEE